MLIEAAMGISLVGIGLGLATINKQKLGSSKLGKSIGEYEGRLGIKVSKHHCIKIEKVYENILFIAPPGEGKTVCGMINNLLSSRLPKASKIIFDPKGEIYETVHNYRESIGEACIVYEPLGNNAKYNPLDFCREFSDFRDLAYTILSNAAKGSRDETWTVMAMPLLTSAFLYADYCGKPYNTIEHALNLLITKSDDDIQQLYMETGREDIATQWALYTKAKQCDNTAGSIQATLAMNTALFLDPRIKNSTSESTFGFKSLRDKSKTINIFVKYDIDKATYLSSLLAVFFSQMVKELIQSYEKGKSQRILIFADELQNLGKIPNLKEYLAYMRFSKIGVIGCIQTISSLYDTYGKYAGDSIIGCFKTIVLFPSNKDPAVLQMFSSLSGETEIKIDQEEREQKTKKMLFTQDEIRRLKSKRVLIICGNQHYVIDKADYWKDKREYVLNQEAGHVVK